jgi:hypothetical protein
MGTHRHPQNTTRMHFQIFAQEERKALQIVYTSYPELRIWTNESIVYTTQPWMTLVADANKLSC